MSEKFMLTEDVRKRWEPVLNEESAPKFADTHRKNVTTIMLENTLRDLQENNAGTVGFATGAPAQATDASYDPVLISMVRRAMPSLVAHDLVGVQPMTGPTGLIFAMKSWYSANATGTEALHKTIDTAYSGKYTTANAEALGRANEVDATSASTSEPVVQSAPWNEMSFSIEKISVAAQSRALKARYTDELAQDLRALHGLDAAAELSNILSSEIVAEINREMVSLVFDQAKPTGVSGAATDVFTTGGNVIDTVDLAVGADFDGRWEKEQLQNLMLFLNKVSMDIAKDTRRGVGNVIITNPTLAGALEMVGRVERDVIITGLNQIDMVGVTYMGVLNGRWKLFVDPYMPNDDVIVGYKGSTPYDAGYFYCPYVPMSMMRSRGEEDFQPRMGVKTRYGVVHNPFVSGNSHENSYFRKFRVLNIPGA